VQQVSCPQCQAALRKHITGVGYLCVLAAAVAVGLTAFVVLPLFPIGSLLNQLMLVLVSLPFLACVDLWGTAWRLSTPERTRFRGSRRALQIGLLILGILIATNLAIITYTYTASGRLHCMRCVAPLAFLWLISLVALRLLARGWRTSSSEKETP